MLAHQHQPGDAGAGAIFQAQEFGIGVLMNFSGNSALSKMHYRRPLYSLGATAI
jgi:hypothetical protein